MMNLPTVHNKHYEDFDIYIGRGSIWGNPYIIGKDGTREEVIQKYKKWLWFQIKSSNISKNEVLNLAGKRLGCYCSPRPCHGDVIIALFKYLIKEEFKK